MMSKKKRDHEDDDDEETTVVLDNDDVDVVPVKATRFGEIDAVRRVLQDKCANFDCTNFFSNGGQSDPMRLLLDNGANLNRRNDEKWTPLYFACRE